MSGRRGVDLPLPTLLSLLQRDNLGDPHPILAGGELYISTRFADHAERSLRADLAAAGLDDRDRLDELRNVLALVQHARTEYYGWITLHGDVSAVLVAAIGGIAASLSRTGDRVHVQRTDSRRLAESLLHQLPDAPAGHGESITLRETDYTTNPRNVLRRSRPDQARRLDTVLRAPRRAAARLYAASRDDAGTRSRSREWLTMLYLDNGRWLVHTTLGRGERSITAVPGTPQLIASKLTELHAATVS